MDNSVTIVPTKPVRYSYTTPSMSRRGGVRLHPVLDGVVNPNAVRECLRTRDIGGNKLVDVVDPETGFCVGTTSKIESAPVNPAGCETMRSGISGTASGMLKLLPDTVRLDGDGQKVYVDEDGRRIRTTDQGEGWVGAVPRRATPASAPKTKKRGDSVARKRPSGAARVPGATGPGGRITDEDIKSFIRAMATKYGRPAPTVFTHAMMRDGREALKVLRKQAAIALAKSAGK